MPLASTTSGYIVSVPHMAVCVAAFRAVHGDAFELRHSKLRLAGEAAPAVLGSALFAMNIEAVRQLHGMAEPIPAFRAPVMAIALPLRVVMFKASQCLEYQCNFGTVPNDWPLYRDLADVVCALARSIIMATPQYEAAPWHHDRALTVVKG